LIYDRHRQLLPWIFGRGPLGNADRKRSAIPAMGRWKMLDNLRRTLSAPSAVLALLVGWTLPLHAAVAWTLFVLTTIMLPTLIPVVVGLIPRRPGVLMRSHFGALGADLRFALAQSGLLISLLAHQAWSMSSAITRTVFRLLVTRRHLLEWTTAAQAAVGQQLGLLGYYHRMAGAVVIAILALIISVFLGVATWPLTLPFVMLWMLSPALARWTSDDDAAVLRLTARETWRLSRYREGRAAVNPAYRTNYKSALGTV
jgi:cyclic beta-1,2-glucan synthetase